MTEEKPKEPRPSRKPKRTTKIPLAEMTQSMEAFLRVKQVRPHARELVDSFFKHLGGVDAFAKMIADDLRLSKVGSANRLRLMQMMGRALTVVSGAEGDTENLANLTDEDLVKSVMAHIGPMSKVHDAAQGTD